MTTLSLVIPAFNEERRLPASLDRLMAYLDQWSMDWEIIVIDDGSVDATADLVLQRPQIRLLRNKQTRGKGFSVKRGALESAGDYIIFTDADLSVPPEFIQPMVRILQSGIPVVIGSRRTYGSAIVVHQPFVREKLGQLFNMAIRGVGLSNFHDTQCGFKGFSREAARSLFSAQKTDGFAFDVEILAIANHFKIPVEELPVQWFNSGETKVIPLLDPLRMLLDVLRIRYYAWRGLYKPPLNLEQH